MKTNQTTSPTTTSTKKLPYTPPKLNAEGDVRALTQNATLHMGSLFGMTSPSLPDAPTR